MNRNGTDSIESVNKVVELDRNCHNNASAYFICDGRSQENLNFDKHSWLNRYAPHVHVTTEMICIQQRVINMLRQLGKTEMETDGGDREDMLETHTRQNRV